MDWSGGIPTPLAATPVRDDRWLLNAINRGAGEKTLAELTGLTVRVPK